MVSALLMILIYHLGIHQLLTAQRSLIIVYSSNRQGNFVILCLASFYKL